MACVEEKNKREEKRNQMATRGGEGMASHQLGSAATRSPEQHLGGSDPSSPAAAVQSSPSLKKEQPFNSDFRNQGNRATSLQLQMGPFI